MKYWRYQILRHTDEEPVWYGLHEVYLDEDGKIKAHTERAEIVGDSPAEIVRTLKYMMKDVEKYCPIDEPEYGGLEDA
jgi:hypothetical protein